MTFIFHSRAYHGRRPAYDEEGAITSLGLLGETIDEESTYITSDVVRYYATDGVEFTHTDLAVGEFMTAELDYDGSIGVYDLYRVS